MPPSASAGVGVQRGGGEAAVRGQRLDHQVEVELEPVGDLGGPRCAPELLAQVGLDRSDPGLGLLHRARRTHRPAVVAEVATHLAADGRDGVAQEVGRALGVEPADGLDQSEVGDLLEILDRDAARPVAASHVDSDLHVDLDHLVLEAAPVVVVRGEAQAQEPLRGVLAGQIAQGPPDPGFGDSLSMAAAIGGTPSHGAVWVTGVTRANHFRSATATPPDTPLERRTTTSHPSEGARMLPVRRPGAGRRARAPAGRRRRRGRGPGRTVRLPVRRADQAGQVVDRLRTLVLDRPARAVPSRGRPAGREGSRWSLSVAASACCFLLRWAGGASGVGGSG